MFVYMNELPQKNTVLLAYELCMSTNHDAFS